MCLLHTEENLLLSKNNPHGTDMCVDGRAPKWGETFVNKHMANVLKVCNFHILRELYCTQYQISSQILF